MYPVKKRVYRITKYLDFNVSFYKGSTLFFIPQFILEVPSSLGNDKDGFGSNAVRY